MTQLYAQELIKVKTQAKMEATKLGHKFVTAEHLLLGILCTPQCQAYEFLKERGITEKKVRQALGKSFSSAASQEDENFSLIPNTKPLRSLRNFMAFNDAEKFAQGYNKPVNSIHLLWAILRMDHSQATLAIVKDSEAAEKLSREIENKLYEPTMGTSQLNKVKIDWQKRLAECATKLRGKIVGQDEAIKRVTDTLTRSWAGLLGSNRPMASFLFVGPRGSGKKTLAINIARYIFDDPERIINLNLSDFINDVSAEHLQEILLLTLGRDFPFGVIYIDGLEQVHPKAMECIHQILDKGHFVNLEGKRIEFRDYIIVLSLSLDSEFFKDEMIVGFRKNRGLNYSSQEIYERQLMTDIENALRADTIRLVDETVFFPPLNNGDQTLLLESWGKELNEELKGDHVQIQFAESVFKYLIQRSEDMGQGVGSLRRLFNRELGGFVARARLDGSITDGHKAEVIYEEGNFAIHEIK
ncbi:AAA family ATPase [bacterium]|nr:AAA family ATPase [bacterium]